MVVLRFATHASILISLCIRVVAAAEGVVFEVVAEPRERLEQAQQVERRENQAQGPVDPGAEQQTQGKLPVHVLLF